MTKRRGSWRRRIATEDHGGDGTDGGGQFWSRLMEGEKREEKRERERENTNQ